MSTKRKDAPKPGSKLHVYAPRTKPTKETEKKVAKKEEKTPISDIRARKRVEEDDKKPKARVPLKPTVPTSGRPTRPLQSKVKPKKADTPVTPPSSRVTKTQFFPSKKMYANALTSQKKATSTSRKEDEELSSVASAVPERPRTATLRKASIVHANIVGPEAPPVKAPSPSDEYEDDFDSYESDFEEEHSSESMNLSEISTGSSSGSSVPQSPPKRISSASTDDEKKLDSGNFDLPEFKHKQILDNIKESIERENTALASRNNLGSLSDEGFEEGKSLQFINFLGAQKKYNRRKSMEKQRKRGEEIMSMIRLDACSFTLMEFAPVPYEDFIRTFGTSNTVQASVQTGEDDLDEEVQTEEILHANKWTQFPPSLPKIDSEEKFWDIYRCNYLGTGGDDVSEDKTITNYNEQSLERFLKSAGNLMLNIQAETSGYIQETKRDQSTLSFSKGSILCNTSSHDLLKNRPIKDVAFSPLDNSKFLTVHGCYSEDFGKSVVALWNIYNLSEPDTILTTFGDVDCSAFAFTFPNVVFGGLHNGVVVVWNTKESSILNQTVKNNESTIIIRPATFSTGVKNGHCSPIVSLQSLVNTTDKGNIFNSAKSTEVCSLDEDGEVIVWGVIFTEPSNGIMVENQGLAHWGSVILTINTRISLRQQFPEVDDFKCTSLASSHLDSTDLYISTNYGIIVHCLCNGGRPNIRKYRPDKQTRANCLEMCPFAPNYFTAGFDSGSINFYSRIIERPLMVMSNKADVEGGNKVDIIRWSYNCPLVLYVKHGTNKINVWNLKVSDIAPAESIPFEDTIVHMKLSPVIKMIDADASDKSYMIIATKEGRIYVHLLNDDHGPRPLEQFEDEKKKFLNYINRYV